MKKMICSLLTVAVVLSTPLTTFAAQKESETFKPNILAIREDVAQGEAMSDNNFNLSRANASNDAAESRAVTWNVWGTSIDGKLGAIPVGYSEHKNGSTVLETYHYTRTYLGSIAKRGDSGRTWGTKTVRAEGTSCDYDVWDAHTQIVKYGTEE